MIAGANAITVGTDKTMNDYLHYTAAAIGAVLGYFFGEFDGFIHALIAFVILDYISGMLAAYIKRELSSRTGFNGIVRKVTIFIIVAISQIIDRELLSHIDLFKGTEMIRDMVICFYLANEGLSILENAIKIGIPIPNIVKERLLAFKNESGVNKHR